MSPIEFGLDTFGDLTVDEKGEHLSYAQTIRDIVAEGVLAEEVGVDFFGVGEHHRDDFAVSSPETVLAGIATQTSRIRLGSAVTVLSSDDPVRVFQRFATVDALSNGRAEVILGRGSFTESFPLFGYDLSQYQELFEQKLDLFAELLKEQPVTWSGSLRPALYDQSVYPTTEGSGIPTWIGVGGSPESVVRAARYGMPLVLAIIGGDPERFAPYVDLFHRALEQLEQPRLPVAVHSPGYIAETDEQAFEEYWPHHEVMFRRIGAERGWPPPTPNQLRQEARDGALYLGSPETVARKMATKIAALGVNRFDMKYSVGTLPHANLTRSIELYGTKVLPMVKDMLS